MTEPPHEDTSPNNLLGFLMHTSVVLGSGVTTFGLLSETIDRVWGHAPWLDTTLLSLATAGSGLLTYALVSEFVLWSQKQHP